MSYTLDPYRDWCMRLQYRDLAPVLFGTVSVPSGAKLHEIETALSSTASKHIPHGYKILDLIPGSLWFRAPATTDDLPSKESINTYLQERR